MKKIIPGIVIASMLLSCNKEKTADRISPATDKDGQEIIQNTIKINKDKNIVKERFHAPEGYDWIEEKPDSFGYFIEHFRLKDYSSPVLKYDGTPIATQHLHEAVFDIDTGSKDLQQCADAVIRLSGIFV